MHGQMAVITHTMHWTALFWPLQVISDDDDVTDEQEEAYNDTWGDVANFLDTCGVDDERIEDLADDDASGAVGSAVPHLYDEDRDELEVVFVMAGSADDMLTEAFKKVVRNGEIKFIKNVFVKNA